MDSTQSFGPEFRLHHSWEFSRFFNQSQVFRLSECTIFRIPNEQKNFRLGITLKARGSSIERNQVKRQLRDFFRKHPKELALFDYNVVIPARKKMGRPFPQQLRTCLEKQFLHALSER
jgi:ribonuclease P protein component